MEKFGFLFQGGALFDSLPIWENVAFRLLHHKKIDKKQAREIAIQTLKSVGLSDKTADLFPSELSGGMQKRASLARAIASAFSQLIAAFFVRLPSPSADTGNTATDEEIDRASKSNEILDDNLTMANAPAGNEAVIAFCLFDFRARIRSKAL